MFENFHIEFHNALKNMLRITLEKSIKVTILSKIKGNTYWILEERTEEQLKDHLWEEINYEH